jgi:3-phosphoshikimate 1-carboxyvinyltransferase
LKYNVQPSSHIAGEITVPGDKSISHRAIMFASLAEGKTHVKGFLQGEDCLATLHAFEQMGVRIDYQQNGEVTIHGVGRDGLQTPKQVLDCGNSGTSMRLLTGLLAGQGIDATLVGDGSLMQRPMRRVCDPVNSMGANIETAESGAPPVVIKSVPSLKGIRYPLPVASAQVKSAVLLAGLFAEGVTEVIEPKATRDHTERMLQSFSYPIQVDGPSIKVEGGHALKGADINVPSDISSAAFFIVAACIAPEGEITLHNVGMNPTRTGVLDILKAMNASIEIHNEVMQGGEPTASITVKSSQLRGIDVPPELVPSAIDEFPVLCVAAACAEGTTRVTQAEELRVKESDRIALVAEGLNTLGVSVQEYPDGLSIEGGAIGGGMIRSGHDHRIAMAFTMASLRAQDIIQIDDCANVATSFPGFVDMARAVGLNIHVEE